MILRFTIKAEEDLLSLEKKIAERIYKKLEWYSVQKDPWSFAEPLTGYHARYRFRIGNYRAICYFPSEGEMCILLVLAIRHRREVYRDL
jgi:mRNA-degrading endonuclease RelE of RelBE toxin-antitoxin system